MNAPVRATAGVSKEKSGTNLLASGSALMGAKVVFVIAGYALYAALSRLLSPADFGTFLVVNSTVAVLNAVFVTGTIQAVSRFVAMSPESAAGTLRSVLRLQTLLATVAGGAYLAAAPLIASVLGDPSLTNYLRISAVIPIAYAFYAVFIGYANGRRWFGAQAGFDVGFSTLKLALVVGLPWAGFGVFGAVAGFSLASLLILAGAWLVIGRAALTPGGEGRSASEIFRYQIAVVGHVAVTNLLMQTDLLMVKALFREGDASAAAGLYGAAVKLAQIPQSILVALNFLIFPYIARATASSSGVEAAPYVRQALRVGLTLTAGPAVVLAVLAPGALALVFGPAYTAAAAALTLLAIGYVALALLTMATTILNGAGRPVTSLMISLGALAVLAVLARLWIPSHGLSGGAAASASGYALGLTAALAVLAQRFGLPIPGSTVARVAVACGVIVFASRLIGPLSILVSAPALGVLYLLVLFVLREWRLDEVHTLLGSKALPSQS